MSFKDQISDILHERTHYDFVGRKKLWFTISGVAIAIGVLFLVVGGLNFGIDFEGGTAWQAPIEGKNASTAEVRELMGGNGLPEAEVAILRTGGNESVRVQAERATKEEQDKIAQVLADYGGVQVDDVSITDVGPTWGSEVSSKAIRALVFFFIAIAAYLSLRFEPKMAVAALAAVVHDILITVGAYAITGFEVTPATVIAFLTILGFSLYDTVVVFDKVKENAETLTAAGRETYSDMVNRSMNEVLMRSLNTSIVASLPVFSLLVVGSYLFGALTIRDFSLALTVGLLTGAYSSIFTATPLLAMMKEREPRYAALRQRLATGGRATAAAPTAPAPARGSDGEPEDVEEPARVGAPVATPRRPGPPPRPRQQRRKRR
ncbi:MAG: protein translocase subunit SecF [Acidimicrobiia bacterium]